MIGKASLKVFTAHLLFIFVALTLVNDGTDLGLGSQAALITITLFGLYLVALVSERAARPRQQLGHERQPSPSPAIVFETTR